MQNFLIGVLGNIAAAVIVAIVPLTIIVLRSDRRQRQIASFFGLNSGVRTIHILLSRYQPEMGEDRLAGDVDIRSRGYVGETVAVEEFLGAQALRDLFDSRWIVASVASVIDGLASGKRDFGKIDVTVSPVPAVRPGNGTIILMGTGARESNGLAEKLLGRDPDYSVYRFTKDEKGRAFERMAVRGYSEHKYYASDHPSGELAVLQRITMTDGRVTFLCAGKDVSGSRLAAEFLARNWDSLRETYGSQKNGDCDFALLYVFYPATRASEILDTVL